MDKKFLNWNFIFGGLALLVLKLILSIVARFANQVGIDS